MQHQTSLKSLGPSTARSSGPSHRLIAHAKSKKQRDYGSGRKRLGIDGDSNAAAPSSPAAPQPTLGEYLQFGKLIGERVQDVQRQLDINNASVVVDEASERILDEWKNEQEIAYQMFEAMVDDGIRGRTAAQGSSTLQKNKNRLAPVPKSLARFVERQYGDASRPLTAAERKLARNKRNAGGMERAPVADDGSSSPFELITAGAAEEPVELVGKPARPGGAAEDDRQDASWTAEISDEEWDEGISTDEEDESAGEPLPPPTYEDFEAALGATSSKKNKGSGSVVLRLTDIPKKPKSLPKPDLAGKPIARPEMVEAAQPAPPPPPPSLAGPPKPPSAAPSAPVKAQVSKVVQPPVVAEKKEEVAPKPQPVPELKAAPAKPPPMKAAEKPVVVAKKEAPASPDTPAPPLMDVSSKPAPSTSSPSPAPAAAAALPTPVQTPTRPTARPTPNKDLQQQREAERAARRARALEEAIALQSERAQAQVKIWQVNAAGVLVTATDSESALTGFVPLTELAHTHAAAVLAEERRLMKEDQAAEGPALRRPAMAVLKDQVLLVEVIALDPESGRIILSERAAGRSMARKTEPLSPDVLSTAAEMLGTIVLTRVRSVRPFGIFVDFPVEVEKGKEELAIGLVHASELSWDTAPLPGSEAAADAAATPTFYPGQQVPARVGHVDLSKGRIFLSVKRAMPNPLLETLDTLLANTSSSLANRGAAAAEGAAQPSGPRQTIDAAIDVRPLLGDLEVALKFVEAVQKAEGIASATLGVRLESRASSPDVEIYMAKENNAATSDEEATNAEKVYKLVLRKGRDVQEVEIVSVLERGAIRQLAADTVAIVGAQTQA